MTVESNSPYEALERIFHEPNRLAIMSALAASRDGLAFTELKDICGLTDGNLNRHLKVLEDDGAVRIEKKFVDVKPRTTVFVSTTGIERFSEYLEALSHVLKKAQNSVGVERARTMPFSTAARRVRA